MTTLLQLLQKPLPEENQPKDLDERKKYPWWKCKKWVANIFTRMFSRYGDAKLANAKTADEIQFVKTFSANYAPKIVEACFHVLSILYFSEVFLSCDVDLLRPQKINITGQKYL